MSRRRRTVRRLQRTRSLVGPPQIAGPSQLRGVIMSWPVLEHFPSSGPPSGGSFADRPFLAVKIDQNGRVAASRMFWDAETAPRTSRQAALEWARMGTVPGVMIYMGAATYPEYE